MQLIKLLIHNYNRRKFCKELSKADWRTAVFDKIDISNNDIIGYSRKLMVDSIDPKLLNQIQPSSEQKLRTGFAAYISDNDYKLYSNIFDRSVKIDVDKIVDTSLNTSRARNIHDIIQKPNTLESLYMNHILANRMHMMIIFLNSINNI